MSAISESLFKPPRGAAFFIGAGGSFSKIFIKKKCKFFFLKNSFSVGFVVK